MGPPRSNCITEGQHLRFNRNVGNECQDFARVSVGRADGHRFSKVVFHNIACRDVATIGRELADKFATHASASAGDDSDSSGESFFKTFSHGFPQCVTGGNHNPTTDRLGGSIRVIQSNRLLRPLLDERIDEYWPFISRSVNCSRRLARSTNSSISRGSAPMAVKALIAWLNKPRATAISP